MPPKNKQTGIFGESLAKDFLIKKGYKILIQNQKVGHKEIDLIAQKNKNIIFVEVKTRQKNGFPEADESLSSKQIKSLKKAIKTYSVQNKINLEKTRLDLIAINLKEEKRSVEIKHYKEII